MIDPPASPLEDVGELATKPSWPATITRLYRLQAQAKRWLCFNPDGSRTTAWGYLAGCHRYCHKPAPGKRSGVGLLANPINGHGFFSGVQTCASPWACPVCANVIWEQRRRELAEALYTHRERGGAVLFITLTASHHHTALEGFLDALAAARRALYTGGAFTRFKQRMGYLGAICGTEITWSFDNGWHPHFHILWLLDTLTPEQLAEVTAYVTQAWPKVLAQQGVFASTAHGVTVKESSWDIEEYMTKMGHARTWDLDAELTVRDQKNPRRVGFAAMQLLDRQLVASSPTSSKLDARRLFVEYATATRRHHSLRWSPGLRAKLGLAPVEDDETAAASEAEHEAELAPEEGPIVSFGTMPVDQWRVVLGNDAVAELRIVLGQCNYAKLCQFLVDIAVTWVPDNPGDRPRTGPPSAIG